MPVAVLKPMIGATEAVSKTLMGMQNTIDPNKRLQMEDKYVEFCKKEVQFSFRMDPLTIIIINPRRYKA